MKREARLLYARAVDSLVMGVDHFNRCWDRGRTEAVLIFLDRAFELLLKAIIVEKGGSIRDKRDNRLTIGYDACLRLCFSDAKVKCLSEEDVIALQNLNHLRDAAQHYIVEPSEGQLYVYSQAAVTAFKKLSEQTLAIDLEKTIPNRMVVVSASPPASFAGLLDTEFAEIKKMVAPGSRKRLDAHARLRTLAVLERSLEGGGSQPTASELNKIIRRINADEDWRKIFPGVAAIYIDPEADGIGLSLKITKNTGEAIHIVPEGSPGSAVVAVRRVNELDYYSLGFLDLLAKLKKKDSRVGFNKLHYLIEREGLQGSLDHSKSISIGKSKHIRYSAKALDHLYKIITVEDIDAIWAARERKGRARTPVESAAAKSGQPSKS